MATKQTVAALLGLEHSFPAVLSVVGCGGKTTFLSRLARELESSQKVLLSTTTKIWPVEEKNVSLCTTLAACQEHVPHQGVQCFGIQDPSTGKLGSLPLRVLEQIVPHYDVVLLEADGSAGRPCKGWRGDEPVIPSFTTHTLGLVTLEGLGQPADESTVLRPPLFHQLTGLSATQMITPQALLDMVRKPNGMFRHSVGKKSLWVNQIESASKEQAAQQWLKSLEVQAPSFFHLLAYGSARSNRWKEWKTSHV